MDDLNNWLDRAFEDEERQQDLKNMQLVPEQVEEEQPATAEASAPETPTSAKAEETTKTETKVEKPTVNYEAEAPLQSIDGVAAKVPGTMEKYGNQGNKYELRNGYIFEKPEYTKAKREQPPGFVEQFTYGPFGRSPSNVGFVQNAVGVYNILTPGPDFDGPRKFEDKTTQAWANTSGNVLFGIGAGSVLKLGGTALASQPWLPSWLAKILNSKFIAAAGGYGATVGPEVAATAADPSSKTDDNEFGFLKNNIPDWFGWIPNDLATIPSDSPDAKWRKNILSTFLLGTGVEVLPFNVGLLNAKLRNKLTSSIIPKDEIAKKYFKNRKPIESAEEAFKTDLIKTSKALDEVGEFNLANRMEKGVDLDQPIKGVHDVYDQYESAVNVVDDFAMPTAAINNARVAKNLGTIKGRLGSVIGDGGIKWATSSVPEFTKSLKGLIKGLKSAGQYDWKQGAKQLSFKEIMKQADELANRIYDMDLGQLKKFVESKQYIDPSTGIPALPDVDFQAVQLAIKKETEALALDPIGSRAIALAQQSVAGEAADLATVTRLMEGTTAEATSIDRSLDRLQYLMVQRGFTSYVRGRALNMMNMWKRLIKGDETAATAFFDAGKSPLLDALNKALKKSDDFIGTFRYLAAENPEYVKPFMTAVELSDGDISTLDDLFKFYYKAFSTSSLIANKDPENMSILAKMFWQNKYSNELASFKTSAKAWTETMMSLYGTPINRALGAARYGDRETREESLMILSKVWDIHRKTSKQVRKLWKASELDPDIGTPLGRRDEIIRKSKDMWTIAEQVAEAEAALGNDGPMAMFNFAEQIAGVVDDPIARIGQRGLITADAYSAVASAEIEGWSRAFLDLKEGRITKELLEQVQEVHVNSMFDGDGFLIDGAVKFRAQEAALNLDTPVTNALSSVMNMFPPLRLALPYSKTMINKALQTMASMPKLRGLTKKISDFSTLPTEITPNQAREVLVRHNVPFDIGDADVLNAYKNKFYEYKSRQMLAGSVLTLGGIQYYSGGLTGDNTSDASQRRWRNEAQVPYRSIYIPGAGWVSYEGLPFGLDNYLASVANTMDEASYGNLDMNWATSKLKSLSFILANGLTDPQLFKALDPLTALLDGDVTRFNNLTASTVAGQMPAGSNLFLQFTRMLNTNVKYIDDEFNAKLLSRSPFAALNPDDVSIITGDQRKISSNPFMHVVGTFTPFGATPDLNADEKFLIDVMWTPRFRETEDGIKLTNDEKLAIKQWIGKNDEFSDLVSTLRKRYNSNEFRAELKSQQYKPGFEKAKKQLARLHLRLDDKWNQMQQIAIARLGIRNRVRKESIEEDRRIESLRDARPFLNKTKEKLSY